MPAAMVSPHPLLTIPESELIPTSEILTNPTSDPSSTTAEETNPLPSEQPSSSKRLHSLFSFLLVIPVLTSVLGYLAYRRRRHETKNTVRSPLHLSAIKPDFQNRSDVGSIRSPTRQSDASLFLRDREEDDVDYQSSQMDSLTGAATMLSSEATRESTLLHSYFEADQSLPSNSEVEHRLPTSTKSCDPVTPSVIGRVASTHALQDHSYTYVDQPPTSNARLDSGEGVIVHSYFGVDQLSSSNPEVADDEAVSADCQRGSTETVRDHPYSGVDQPSSDQVDAYAISRLDSGGEVGLAHNYFHVDKSNTGHTGLVNRSNYACSAMLDDRDHLYLN